MKIAILSLASFLTVATTSTMATDEVEYMNEIKIMDGHTKRHHVISPLPHT